MEQFLNEKITEAKREVDRLTHVCQTKPFDSADFFENEFQIERLAAQIEVYELIFVNFKFKLATTGNSFV